MKGKKHRILLRKTSNLCLFAEEFYTKYTDKLRETDRLKRYN